ncbi:MAG: hypothetical protein BMS9Abin09_0406 [Gammaproteobacteria bacterium]|nr:MAG: hypothetical protein BMS9Abin09_0406 [Gammaproteobacteria bacterium]
MYKVIVISLTILLSGCGDNSSKEEKATRSELEGESTSPKETTLKQAILKIGKHQYEFKMTQCNSMLRFGSGKAKDGSNVTLSFELPPADWKSRPASEGWTDNGSFRIRDKENNLDWTADEDIPRDLTNVSPGQSQVDDFTIDGKRVSGSATFVDVTAVMTSGRAEPVKGTFEVECNQGP